MPRHSMALSRHQDKLLQTPATLETLGSTSAVPLRCLEALKAACVNSWIHRHGAGLWQGDLFQSLAAGIMLVEPQQSSDNSLCSPPAASNTSQAGNYLPQTPKKAGFGSKLEAKV